MRKNIKDFVRSKWFEYLVLVVIIILGFVVRLYKINNPIADWHSWRQADTAAVTRIYVQNGINLLIPRYYDISSIQSQIFNPNGYRMVEFPFFNAFAALLSNASPVFSMEVWSRLLTISCALITAFFLYLIGKRLFGGWGGILSAAFYLFIPYNIYFTRVILPDPMGVTFGVVSLWAFMEFTERDNDFFFYFSAIFFDLALLIKPYLGFYLIPMIYLAVRRFGLKNILKDKVFLLKSLIFAVISFVPFFAWRLWESRYPAGIPLFWWAFNGDGIRFRPSFWYWIFGERLGHLILGSLGLVPFVFGVFNTKVKNLFVHWFLFGVLFYVVVVATANVKHDYYQTIIMPAIALTLASGSIYLWTQTIFNKVFVKTVLIFSIFVMIVTGWYQIVGDYAINHPEIIEAGQAIDKLAPKDAKVIATYNGDTAFLYQTKRFGWPVIDDSIDNMIKQGASYYLSVDLNSSDTLMFAKRFKTVQKTNNYIILDLHQEIKTK